MKKVLIVISIISIFGCANRNLGYSGIFIQNDKAYGELKNGTPDKDTLIELKNKAGNRIGIGKVAMDKDGIGVLKTGFWKEYDENENLVAEGNYKISSYVDCCTAGACRVFYFYRDGQWKYFNKTGELKFMLNFVPREHSLDTRCEGGDKMIFGLIEKIPLKYMDKVTPDELYELQKVSFSDSYITTTMIPLNGKVFYEIKNDF